MPKIKEGKKKQERAKIISGIYALFGGRAYCRQATVKAASTAVTTAAGLPFKGVSRSEDIKITAASTIAFRIIPPVMIMT